MPNATYERFSSNIDAVRLGTTADGSVAIESSSPVTTNVFRTRVGLPPARIHLSDAHPHNTAEIALTLITIGLIYAIMYPAIIGADLK